MVAGYDRQAEELAERYEQFAFEKVHEDVLDLLPEAGASVLDVGAGSGRDAAWFASKGYQVMAVEPSTKLRKAAQARHRSADICWFNDKLPSLEKVLRSKMTFDLIWVSAMWMHVPHNDRERAFRKLVSVMSPGASMMISLRQGPSDPTRPMRKVQADEIEKLAIQHGIQVSTIKHRPDVQKRRGISWKVIWLRLPDDGTNALPLLRHVVFLDRKSSTYKLALLRVLVRIADSASGFTCEINDGKRIKLPLGLVALHWIRSFWPLVVDRLPQLPGNRGQAFVRKEFRELIKGSIHDLRVGAHLSGQPAENLVRTMRHVCSCIVDMPSTHITFPGSDSQVFEGSKPQRYTTRIFDSVHLDQDFLWSFGALTVPTHLWRAMSRYAPWIEPAIVTEWIRLMRRYQKKPLAPWETLVSALEWLDPKHETNGVRAIARNLKGRGARVHCVWTGRLLDLDLEIDHCFPFATWPCNDLWNLLPTSRTTNSQKRDLLPSPQALENAKPQIWEWWDTAYLNDDALKRRFKDESLSALPTVVEEGGQITLESVFEGLMVQQMVLKRNQQLREWTP